MGPTRVFVYWDCPPNAVIAWRLSAYCGNDRKPLFDRVVDAEQREVWLNVPPDTTGEIQLFGQLADAFEALGRLSFETPPTQPASLSAAGGWVRWGADGLAHSDAPSPNIVPVNPNRPPPGSALGNHRR